MNASLTGITSPIAKDADVGSISGIKEPLRKTADVAAPTFAAAQSISGPRERAYRIAAILLLGDGLVATGAIFVGLALREWQRAGSANFPSHLSTIIPYLLKWSFGGGFVFAWLMAMLKTYELGNLYRIHFTGKNVIKSTLLWAIGVWACVGLFNIENFSPRLGVMYCLGLNLLFLLFWRLIAFVFLSDPRVKEAASSRIILVGWNHGASLLRRAVRMDIAQLGEIIGCVPMPGGKFAAKPPADLAVLGDYNALPQLVAECQATSIILADVNCTAGEISSLVSFCQREMVSFKMVPKYFPALGSGLHVQTVSGVPLLGIGRLPLDRTVNRVVKRTIDIVGGVLGLIASATIVPFFCLIVYFESPGSVIYKQLRTSRNGRSFFIYKIRSMKINAETSTGAVWCKQEDPRRLRIGSFMRKWNIDELPQFFNVIKGDMSLVGPRPERPELIKRFKSEIPNYNARHEVRAGLTGWAQINGLRGDTDLTKRIEADLYYLENWSVFLDLYCIFATVFKTKNAY